MNGFTLDETGVEDTGDTGPGHEPPGEADDPASTQEQGNAIRDYIAALPVASFPNMVDLADQFTVVDADERFEMLIEIFVDGLARPSASA